jgi:hypothetical protein
VSLAHPLAENLLYPRRIQRNPDNSVDMNDKKLKCLLCTNTLAPRHKVYTPSTHCRPVLLCEQIYVSSGGKTRQAVGSRLPALILPYLPRVVTTISGPAPSPKDKANSGSGSKVLELVGTALDKWRVRR